MGYGRTSDNGPDGIAKTIMDTNVPDPSHFGNNDPNPIHVNNPPPGIDHHPPSHTIPHPTSRNPNPIPPKAIVSKGTEHELTLKKKEKKSAYYSSFIFSSAGHPLILPWEQKAGSRPFVHTL